MVARTHTWQSRPVSSTQALYPTMLTLLDISVLVRQTARAAPRVPQRKAHLLAGCAVWSAIESSSRVNVGGLAGVSGTGPQPPIPENCVAGDSDLEPSPA